MKFDILIFMCIATIMFLMIIEILTEIKLYFYEIIFLGIALCFVIIGIIIDLINGEI